MGGSILGLFVHKADMLATKRASEPGVWIPKMWGREGRLDGTHTISDFVLKNDQNNKYDFHFCKRQFKQSKLLLKQVISIITCMHDISARRYIL